MTIVKESSACVNIPAPSVNLSLGRRDRDGDGDPDLFKTRRQCPR